MTTLRLNRRGLLLGTLAASALPGAALAAAPSIHVLKDRNCGCCGAWVDIMRRAGFDVTTENMHNGLLIRRKMDLGIPPQMASCHTAMVDGFIVEGHVPAADVRRLLEERPDARGIAVPGMPYGSPGMGPESRREAYDVHLIRRDGTTGIFTRYDAA